MRPLTDRPSARIHQDPLGPIRGLHAESDAFTARAGPAGRGASDALIDGRSGLQSMTPRIAWIATPVVLALVLASVAFLASNGGADPASVLRPDDAKLLMAGERIYIERCASCHGARLEGQPEWRTRGPDGLLPAPPHDASGHTWHHADDVLFRITKYGVAKAANLADYRSAMPGFEGVLSDEDILAVLSWIKSRWPASIRRQHDEINARQASQSAR